MLPVWQFGGHSSGFLQLQATSHLILTIQYYVYCRGQRGWSGNIIYFKDLV